MVTREDIEAFLDRLSADGASHQELEPGLWLVRPSGALEFDVVWRAARGVYAVEEKHTVDVLNAEGLLAGLR